jgi:nucleoside-diphosphate-sugar epimerase
MRIFLAGATGAVGKRLVPLLVQSGHTVIGTTRTIAKVDKIEAMGAIPAVVDALDRNGIIEAVKRGRPDVIIHELTAIPPDLDVRHFRKAFALTNRLRTEGTDYLLDGARAAGVRRFVAQSYAGLPHARVGGPVKTEDDRLDSDPPTALAEMLKAIQHLESAVLHRSEIEGVVLRYGVFYGPGTGIADNGSFVKQVRLRRVPVVGDGGGVWSFIHMDDVARATQAAIESRETGLFNIVDDDPARVSEWLPALADALGAKPPRHLPAWVARLAVGKQLVIMMTQIRGASNLKAKRLLDWRPQWASWRDGFRHGLSDGLGDPAAHQIASLKRRIS